MELLAFSGYARSGKDEAAKALASLGYQRVAFADRLREFLAALDPIVGYERRFFRTIPIRLSTIISAYGWDGYKETPYVDEIRPLLQRLGTECGRDLLYDDVWVDAALNHLDPNGKYVVADCRFVNEADGIRARGGKVIRVMRAGVGPANSHKSETALDDYDFDAYINNDGTLEDYYKNVQRKVLEIAGRN